MAVKLTAVYVDVVTPVIFVNVVLSSEDCHCIVPVFPVNVINVLLDPAHTELAPLIIPATGDGLTVIVTFGVVADPQLPFVTTAW